MTIKFQDDIFVTAIQLYHHYFSKPDFICQERIKEMTLTQKRILILLIIITVAVILGRLAVRAVLNLMLGGTMFGGNFL